MGSGEFSFQWFARHRFYKAVNARLLDLVDIQPGQRVVELACGTGEVTRLIQRKLKGAQDSLVIAIDQSATALREAAQRWANMRDAVVQFIQSRVEQLSGVVKQRMDAVIFCNGIHYIPDKEHLVDEVYRTLLPGGVFAFNTSFFQHVQLPETEQFLRRWMYRAIRILKRKYNLMPRADKVEARKQLSAEQYRELLQHHGFRIVSEEVSPVAVPLHGWLDISRYSDFVQGALPGVPLKPASEALRRAAREVYRELSLTSVPRNWLSMVAVKHS
ncbi:MAG: class I SAM-dependent methyltransferase [Dehalococcoidia bacterium]